MRKDLATNPKGTGAKVAAPGLPVFEAWNRGNNDGELDLSCPQIIPSSTEFKKRLEESLRIALLGQTVVEGNYRYIPDWNETKANKVVREAVETLYTQPKIKV